MVKTLLSNAGVEVLTSGKVVRIPYPSQPKDQNVEQKQYCDKCNKDFKNGPQ